MRISDLSPRVAPFEDGKTHRASKWSAIDSTADHGVRYRDVFHYSTLMVRFYSLAVDGASWYVDTSRVSVGRGSVSDQQGMNQLIGGWGFTFTRKGGARVEHPSLGEVA